ncbi:MAG: O-antigen ligase family protein [Patescibacteria group bacterium]
MTYRGLQQFYTVCITALLYVVPFLPLYVANSMLFPFITGRNFVFRIIVEIALVLWIGLVFLNKEYRPTLSRVMQAVLIFVGVVFLADLLGASFYRSFWSNYERMEGFLMIAHMVAFFIITATVFRLKEWKIFAHLTVFASLGVSSYALLQRLGYFVSLQGGNRVDGTIGNPTYLAAYLMLSITIALVLFFNTEKRWLKHLYSAGIIFELLIIYFSATRGAVLGVISGFVLFGVLFLWLSRNDNRYAFRKRSAIGVLVAALVIPLFFWSIRGTEFVKSSPALYRLTSVSFSSQTIESRFLIWSMALEGIKERPVLGWGQENFNLVFNEYYKTRLWQQEPWFDRAHSSVFDWLSNAGVLGLVSYLSLFVSALYALWRLLRAGHITNLIFSVAVSGLFAYFVQNLFVFDNFNTYFIFFAALAFLHFAAFQHSHEAEHKKPHHVGGDSNELGVSVSVFAVAIFIGIIAVYFLNIRPIQQARSLINTLQLVRGDAPSKVVMPAFAETLSYGSFGDREVSEQLAQYGTRVADTASVPNDEKRAVLAEVIRQLEKQVSLQPDDIRYRLFLASLGYLRAAFFDQQFAPKAEQEFKKVIEMTPTKQNLYVGLAQLYMAIGDHEKAFSVSRAMYELDREFPDGAMFYIVTAIYSKRFDLAQEAIVLHPEFRVAPRGVFVANAYAAVKKFDAMVPLYKDIIASDPKNPQYHGNLSAVYAQLGKRDLAKQEAEEAIRLDPSFKEQGETFIKSLGF